MTESKLRGRFFYWLFFLSYTVVHLIFEYKFWVQGSGAIWAKYHVGNDPAEMLRIAEQVYYTKATWFFILVWMLALRVRFQDAMAYGFLIYALELVVFFPIHLYTLLNVGLALGMVVEVLVERRRRRAGAGFTLSAASAAANVSAEASVSAEAEPAEE